MTELPNLIPPARLRARRTAAAVRTWAAINCAGVIALAATWALLAGTRDQGLEKLQTQVDQVGASIDDAQTELKRKSTELLGLTRQLAAAPDVTERPEWGVLLSTLGSVRGDAVALTGFDLAPLEAVASLKKPTPAGTRAGLPPHYQLRLSGVARDHRAATGFSLAVERTGLFSQVRLTDATAKSIESGTVVSFSIECVLDDARGGQ